MASKNFSADELRCRDGCGLNLCSQATYDMLEEFRALVGKPVTVTSGYRCAAHNISEHGALHSQHLRGTAADIVVPGMKAAELEAIAVQCKQVVGIGRNDHTGMLHIDCRSGPIARWTYDLNGQQQPWYSANESEAA